jgi:hypothetical protein
MKLEKYKPYNKFWFRDCLYHSLSQIVGNLGQIECLLNDEKLTYGYSFSNGIPELFFIQDHFKGWINCLEEKGIFVNFIKSDGNNLIKKIKTSLERNCPVMLPIDCYYEHLRYDCYMKEHIAHNLVVIGYDDTNEELNILEHRYVNDLLYKEATIKYNEAVEAYIGFFYNIINDDLNVSFTEIDSSNMHSSIDLTQEKKEVFMNLKNFKNSLVQLEKFVYEFEKILNLKMTTLSVIQFYWQMVMNIITIKRVQFSQFEAIRIQYDLPEDGLHNKVLNSWNILMGLLGKLTISKKWSEQQLNKIIVVMNSILEGEMIWSSQMIKYLTEI